MKRVSIIVPTYNEEENVELMSAEIEKIFNEKLKSYKYELIFIDNFSQDNTRIKLRKICCENSHIKAIFNSSNFGWMRSPFYGLLRSSGDCSILIAADFQDPIELIPEFLKEWENGYKVVLGIKKSSEESKLMYVIRTSYYRFISKFADNKQIEHFTGFGLYDKSVIKVFKSLSDPLPYMKGIVSELGFNRKEVYYVQPKRKKGKSKGNFLTLYDTAMLGITSCTKIPLRIATFLGFGCSILSIIIAFVFFILKLVKWYAFPIGIAPILIGLFLIGGILLFFIGILGEYIININIRVMNRPLVIEEECINFEMDEDDG